MASDTRSKPKKKGQEPAATEELVPMAMETSTPIGMESLVQYLLQNNKELADRRKIDQDEAIRREEAWKDEAIRREEAREDRAERRRKQELIEAEERQERREARQLVLQQETEAKMLVLQQEAEAKKLVLLQEAEDKRREQKVEDERRAFNLQQEMLKFQTDLGEKAEDARRIEFEKCRDKDKAKAGILTYKDSDDVEEYLEDAEKKLATSGIPEAEWGSIIASKLHGRLGASWGDLRVGDATFKSMKAKLLSSYGYTPKIAGDQFFNFKQEDLKGMTPDHLWRRGVQLLRRIVAPIKLEAEAEFAIVKQWIWAVVPKRARTLLDGRTVTNQVELTLALQDFLVCEGEKVEGQVSVFGKQHQRPEHSANSSGSNSGGWPVGNCFRCGKPGHKVANCWQKVDSGYGSESARSDSSKTIICFLCGIEGHKSPQCPKKGQQEETKPKEGLGQAKPVAVRRLRVVSPEGGSEEGGSEDTVLDGIVNGRETVIVLDTGTAISVVPKEWVEKELETGEEVSIAVFGSERPVIFPVAKVQFKVKHLEWEEEVALAPTIEGQETEVLCRWNLRSDIGFELFSLVIEREKEQKDEAVGADEGVIAADRPVKTPESVPPVFEDFESETDEEEEEEHSFAAEETEVALLADEKKERNAKVIAKEKPTVREPVAGPVSKQQNEAVGSDKGGRVADRPAQTPESAPPASEEPSSDPEVEEEASLPAEESEDDLGLLAEDEDVVDEEDEVMFCLKPKDMDDIEFEVPPVGKDSSHRAELVEEVCAAATEDIFEQVDLRPSLAEEKDDDLDLVAEVEEVMVELVAEEKEEEHSLAEGDFILKKFGQDTAKGSSVLSPWNINVVLSVVEWTEEGLQAFKDIKVCLIELCIFTIPSEEDVFVLLLYFDVCGPGGDILYFDEREEKELEETVKLRAAPKSHLVGGDVGSSPTEKKERPRSRDATNRTCKNMQADAG